jgi:hypothetical protein
MLLDGGRYLLPDAERPGASAAIASGAHERTSWPEVTVDHRVRREEPLCLFRLLEALHLPLSSPGGPM